MKKICAFFTFLLLMNVAFLSCKKADSNNGISSSFYFTAVIDGTTVTYEDGKNGYGSGVGSSSGTVPAGCQKEQSLNLRAYVTKNSAGVSILKTFDQCSVDCSLIEGMFYVGTYTYGKRSLSTNQNGIDGAAVYYVDNNGTLWSSGYGTATQTNSNFKITEHIENTKDYFSNRITKVTFNCKLYDGNGNSKTLTNGEIRSRSVVCI